MRTSDAITQEIKSASDLVEVVGQYVTLKRVGKSYKGLCPFHREKTPSFYVHPEDQYYNCFGCGAGGDVFKFIQAYNSVTFVEARQILADRANIRIEPAQGSAQPVSTSRHDILRLNRWAASQFQEQLQHADAAAARNYVRSRQISEEMVRRFGLGFAPEGFDFLRSRARSAGFTEKQLLDAGLVKTAASGTNVYDVFRNRLMFPIYDPVGQVLGFGGRTLGDEPAKYINTPETAVFNKRRCLYGLHLTREAFERTGRAILVEGYTDVIMAHQHGFAETIATLGTAMTADHAAMLRRYVPRVYLLFDADEAGQRAAQRGIEIAIRSELDVSLVQIPVGLDPCDYLLEHSASDFIGLLNSAPTALEFKWRNTLAAHQAETSSAARHQAVEDFVSFVGTSVAFGNCDSIQRGLLINQLSRLLGLGKHEVNELIAQARRAAQRPDSATSPPGNSLGASMHNRPHSAEEAAVLELLGIVLCEPRYYATVGQWLSVDLLRDPRPQRVARQVAALVKQMGEFRVQDLLSTLADATDASWVVDRVESERRKANFAERVEAALHRLKVAPAAQLSAKAGQEITAKPATSSAASGSEHDQRLAELLEHTQAYVGFANNFTGIRQLKARSTR